MKKKIANSKKPSKVENAMGLGGPEGFGPGNFPMSGIFDNAISGRNGAAPSQPFEFANNLTYNLITLQQIILTYPYIEYGVFRTLVDQPVKDALKGGVRIKSAQVDEKDIENLERRLKNIRFWHKVKQAVIWSRLFGGAALVINVNEDYKKPFDVTKVKESNKVDFKVADRWELTYNGSPYQEGTTFTLAGAKPVTGIHPTRVIKILGQEAPFLARQRLMGWGMSVIECILREANSSLKHDNVVFELLDEAKVDIWNIENFNSQMLSKVAVGQTTRRIQLATMMKNFLNAIVLDTKDKYEQKQMSFSGLSEILEKIQIKMAAAARMPMSKIYGLSAKGFASGEDDLENYAAIIEDLREEITLVLDVAVPVICMQEWGMVPDDLSFEYKPARTLTADVMENVLTSKFNRHSQLYSQGIYQPKEYCEALKRDGILTIQTAVADGAEPQPPMMAQIDEGAGEEGGETKGSTKAKSEKEAEG